MKILRWGMRILWLIVAPPAVGITSIRLLSYGEGVVRAWLQMPAVVGPPAGLNLNAIFMTLFVLFSWFLIEPLSAVLALAFSLEERKHPVMASVVTALILWVFASLVLHRPSLDSFPMSLVAGGMLVGIPSFCSAVATAYAVTPNKRRLRTLVPRVRSA